MTVWSLCPIGYEHELDLLEIRFAEQDSIVDLFVTSEASTTYSGQPKPFYLDPGDARWAPWRSKLLAVRVDDAPDWNVPPFQHFGVREQWQRENHQRRALGRVWFRDDADPHRGLWELADDDVVVVSDLDEILRPETIAQYIDMETDAIVHPQLPMHRHFLNLRWQDRMGISIARIGRGHHVKHLAFDVELFRRQAVTEWVVPYWRIYEDGRFDLGMWGWHFSWMGGPRAVRAKLRNAAHPEEQTDRNRTMRQIGKILKDGLDIQGEHRPLFWVPDSYLPEHARSDRFEHMRCSPDRATPEGANASYGPDYTWKG